MSKATAATILQDVAKARAREAGILLKAGEHLGAVYLQGYNVECLLKHLLHLRGKPYPKSGGEGHNLRELWRSAGFLERDTHGYPGVFLGVWSTALRYESSLPEGCDPATLIEGATCLAARVTSRIRTANSRRARRRPGKRAEGS